MTDKELKKKELGFKIKDVYEEKNQLVVEAEEPEPTLSKRVFTFGPQMAETKKFVEDGEIVEEPRWKLQLRKKLENEYGDEPVMDEEEKESLKGERVTAD